MRSGLSNANATIVVDLDGPILDIRRRHHACYTQILTAGGCAPLDLPTYWRLKRRQAGVGEILRKSGCAAISGADFERQWLRLIEQPPLLSLDVLQDGALETLRRWKREGFHLVLASMRRNRRTAHLQVRRLEIAGVFDSIRFSPPAQGPRGKAASVVAVTRPDASPKIWVGDTEADVLAARIAGFRSVAVSCGIRSRRLLMDSNPDLLVPRLAAIRPGQLV